VKKSEDANKAAKKNFFAHQNSKNSLTVECLPACRHIRRRELLPLVVFLVMDWKKKERGREDWRTLKSLFFIIIIIIIIYIFFFFPFIAPPSPRRPLGDACHELEVATTRQDSKHAAAERNRGRKLPPHSTYSEVEVAADLLRVLSSSPTSLVGGGMGPSSTTQKMWFWRRTLLQNNFIYTYAMQYDMPTNSSAAAFFVPTLVGIIFIAYCYKYSMYTCIQ
jgi:hypothetical protein